MKITWVKLGYGGLVAAGVAVTTTLLLYDHPEKGFIEPADVIELVEGVNERCFPFAGATVETNAITNIVTTWTDPGTGYGYWITVGTNAVFTNYLVDSGTHELAYTTEYNGVSIGNNAWIRYTKNMYWQEGRYVWNAYTQFVVAGFPDPGYGWGSPDGTYYRSYSTALFTRYTNGLYPITTGDYVWVLTDGGSADRWYIDVFEVDDPTDAETWWNFGAEWFTWYSNSYWETWYSSTGPTPEPGASAAAAGLFTSNYLASCPAMNAATQYVGVQGWVDPNLVREIEQKILNLIPHYVDYVDAVGVHYCTVNGQFAALSIGDGISQFTRTPAHGITNATYGDLPPQIFKVRFQEYYKLLHAMTATVMNAYWTNVVAQGLTDPLTNIVNESDCYESDYPAQPAFGWWKDTTWGGAFFTDDPSSRAYTDYPGGETNVGMTNIPMRTLAWSYYKNRLAGQAYYDASGESPPWVSNVMATYHEATADWLWYTNMTDKPMVFLPYFPAPITATVDFYMRNWAVLDHNSPAWSQTDDWTLEQTHPMSWGSGISIFFGDEVAIGDIGMTNGVVSNLFWYTSTLGISGSCGGRDYNTRDISGMGNEPYGAPVSQYFGAKKELGPAVVRWDFHYCDTPLVP